MTHRALVLLLCLLPTFALASMIKDQGFFIDEAYNQEADEAQHILRLEWEPDHGEWELEFETEWPLFSVDHQLSLEVPFLLNDGGAGLGDIALGYRYQAVGDEDAPIAMAPGLRVSLPTGSVAEGRGTGFVGLHLLVPVSVVLHDRVSTHFNAGASWVPERAGGELDHAVEYFLGQSMIWAVHPSFNPFIEFGWMGRDALGEEGLESVVFVNPGVRFLFEIGGVDVVPGISAPLLRAEGHNDLAVLFYLSIEHPIPGVDG